MNHFNSSLICLYVQNINQSSDFYQSLFQVSPELQEDQFIMFEPIKGTRVGIWKKDSVIPKPANEVRECFELAFDFSSTESVDDFYQFCLQKNISITQKPTTLEFGYAFTIKDPDGHRLRFYSMEQVE